MARQDRNPMRRDPKASASAAAPSPSVPSFLKPVGDGVELTVKIVPGASRDRIVGPLGDALKIQVAAPPEKGKANAAVIRLLAESLGVGEKQLALRRGETSPRKTVRIGGIGWEQIAERLARRP